MLFNASKDKPKKWLKRLGVEAIPRGARAEGSQHTARKQQRRRTTSHWYTLIETQPCGRFYRSAVATST